MTDERGTDERVGLILDVIRYQGEICEFIGIAKSDYQEDDQADLDSALKGLDEATEKLRQIIYKEANVQ